MKTCKKLCISILSIFATTCLSLGIVVSDNINASAETTQLAPSLSMKYGASVRINKTDSYEDNGIRFSATISEDEYEVVRLMDNAVFGMFIMPESYLTRFGDLTAENVNLGGVYDWKENKADEYFYGGSEIQAESHRILAMTYTQLPDDTERDGYKLINGSVVAIKDDNLDMNYVARAFIRYEVDGFYFYEMADWSEGYVKNNVRSVTGVADKALKDTNSNLTANEQKALSDAYLLKSFALDGYTAINSAEDFAAMSANGKYYLAKDITISEAYANEFSGVFNGNGKKITANGTSVFSSFVGTLTNVEITTNASVISSMNGGLVDGITVNYTYSDGAVNAIAASSKKVARVENCILYTDNTKAAFVADASAFVSNCVETTDLTAKYKQIVFATENGEISKLVKEGASISNKFIYGAEATLAGSVNAWNKEFATVTSDNTYYATDSETVYDATAEWEKLADSAIINGTLVNVDAPYGYETVHAGNREWTTTSLSGYTSLRFAAKMSGYFLLSGWTIYSDANDWMQVTMDKQEDGAWTITVYGPVFNGSAWVNSYQKTDVTATTVAEAMNFVSFGYTTYATEVYAVKKVVALNGVKIVEQAIAGSTATTAVAAPEGFEYAYEYASIPANTSFVAVDISGYSEVKFNMWLDKGYICIKSWGAYAENAGWGKQWVPITLMNNEDGTWTILIEALIAGVNQNPYSYSVAGSTLDVVLATWFDFVGNASIYITEIRGTEKEGVEEEPAGWDVVIVEQAIAGSTETTAVTAPEGFEYAYEYASIPANTSFAAVDISGYSEVKFNMWLDKGYICIKSWGAYAENAGWGKQWVPITLTNNGDDTWTILIEALIAGVNQNPYSYSVAGSTLDVVLATWFDFVSDSASIYITEIRGQKLPGWGEKIADSALANATKTVDEAPAGYETVFSKSGLAKGDFADITLAEYSEIRFQLKATSWILFGGWGTYYDKRDWIPWTLTKDENDAWTLRVDVTLSNGATYYEEKLSGNTLKEALNKFYSDAGSITIYSTEVRAMKDTTPVWGDKIINSALGNATATANKAPDKFENVYEKTDLTAGAFANINLSQYKEVRFWIKLNSGWMVLNNSWGTYYAHKNWTKVQLVNNNNGTWALSWYTQAQNTNGAITSESPFTATVSGSTLKAMLANYYGDASTNAYVTELRGIKKDLPTVEVPEITEQPVALETQENTVLWGEQVTDNGAVGFSQVNNVSVPNGYECVVAGKPATTANVDGVRVGEFFEEIDVSAYSEVRFAFKSSSWMLFGGWGSYVHVPDEWVSVKMRQTATNTWTVTVYAKNAVSGADPFTANYTGSTLQDVLLSWYNATGETFYMTDVRGVKGEVDNTVVIDACVLKSDVTLDSTAVAPDGFESVYKVGGTFDTNKKSTTDLSGYSEVRFALKSEKYFLINGWSVYFRESYTDWATVVMKNNGNNSWMVSVYGEVYTGSAYENPYTITYTGNSIATILQPWYNGANIYVTELRGIPAGVNCDVKISNLACTTVYNTTDVTAPAGYDNVYRKDGLEKGDFATIDISSYAEVNFQIQSSSWILYGGWSGMIHTPNQWIAVRLVNQGGNSWKVFVNGTEETTLTYTGVTLNTVLANWYNDKGATFYVTELRGVHGTYTASQIKGIAMLQSDKTTQTKKAALELSNIIKEITGVELLIEYYNNIADLDADKRYLLLGTLAASEVDVNALTTETGYIMQKVGNHVALYATTSDGMYNAVYGFLNTYFGAEFYTDGVMTYTDDNPLIGGEATAVFNPSIEYTWAVDGLLTDGANDDYNWMYINRLGYSNIYSQIGGGSWHNFLTVISEEKYGANGTVAQHSEWFVTKTDADKQSFKTLNVANYGDAIAVAVANEFATMINQTPNVDVWQFSAPDRVDSTFTSNEYVAFMNKVATNLNGQISRKVNLMLLAYNATFEAPTTAFAPQTNVGFTVMAAPIGMNYYYGFDNTTFTDSNGHTNAWYLEQITAWGEKADELYIWNYSVYFDNYFVPLDTITNMQSKYQAYVNAGATGIYDQGSGEANATDWAELKVYLKAELAKNVNADVDALIENFMKAYYGEAAAPYMLQLLNAQQDHYATIAANMRGGHMTRDSLFDKSYWGTSSSNAMLVEWYGYIQSALNVTTNATMKTRIQKEALTIRYLNQVLFNTSSYSGKALTVTTVAGSTISDSLSQIITDAKALGITRFAEGQGWVCNDGTIIGTNNLKDGAIDNLA